jgi:hypothetical protein
MMRIYVGHKAVRAEVFRSDTTPTHQSHGHVYGACTGPFVTLRGAKAMVHYGAGNPHLRTVRDAERIGRKYAKDLDGKPLAR